MALVGTDRLAHYTSIPLAAGLVPTHAPHQAPATTVILPPPTPYHLLLFLLPQLSVSNLGQHTPLYYSYHTRRSSKSGRHSLNTVTKANKLVH